VLVERRVEGSLQGIHEVRSDKSSNNPECFWISMGQLGQENTLDCLTEWRDSLLKWIIHGAVDSSVPQETAPIAIDIDGGSSRERIWRRMFPNSPVPNQDENGVDECFGILSDLFSGDSEPGLTLDEILREVKGK